MGTKLPKASSVQTREDLSEPGKSLPLALYKTPYMQREEEFNGELGVREKLEPMSTSDGDAYFGLMKELANNESC